MPRDNSRPTAIDGAKPERWSLAEASNGNDRRLGRDGDQNKSWFGSKLILGARARSRSRGRELWPLSFRYFDAQQRMGHVHYPLVLGHEIIGRAVAVGSATKGDYGRRASASAGRLSVACIAGSACPAIKASGCRPCRRSSATAADLARGVAAHWAWTIPLPEKLDLCATPARCSAAASQFSIRW